METHSEEAHVFPYPLLLIFLVLTIGIGLAGRLYHERHELSTRMEKLTELSAIAKLKVTEISNWRKERLADARNILQTPFVGQSVRQWREGPDSDVALRHLTLWMHSLLTHFDYDRVRLFDPYGNELLGFPEEAASCSHLDQEMHGALGKLEPMLTDIHWSESTARVHFGVIIPILEPDGPSPLAVLVLSIDPRAYLYPLIQSWPTPSPSAESLLIRRDGEAVVFLNELRHRNNIPHYKLSMGELGLPVTMTAGGLPGEVEGLDYRGVPVLAAAMPIPDTSWLLITKVDLSEINGPLRENARIIMLLVASLIGGAAVSIGLVWRQQRLRFYRRQYEAELQSLQLARRYETLTRYASDIILLTDSQGRVMEANNQAAVVYGYPREDLPGLSLGDIVLPADKTAPLDVKPSIPGGRDGIRFEAVHRRKDGTIFPVEVSSRMVDLEEGELYLSIIRDISERRQAEAKIHRLNRLNGVLSQANQAVVRTREQETLIAQVCRIAIEHGEFRAVWIGMADERRNGVLPMAWREVESGQRVDLQGLLEDEPSSLAPAESAIITGKSFVCNDIAMDPRTALWSDSACKRGLHSIAVVPMNLDERVFGALCVYSGERDFFDRQEVAMLEEIGMDVSFGIATMEEEARRRLAEERLRESQDLYKAIFENTGTATVIVEEDATVVLANKECESLTGLPTREFEGIRDWSPFLFPEDFERISHYHVARRRDPASVPSHYETRFIDSRGSVKDIFVSASLIPGTMRSVVSMLDISERKRMENALRESEEKFSKAFNSSPSVMTITTIEEGRLLEVNRSFTRVTGHEREEVLGRTTGELEIWVEPELRGYVVEMIEQQGSAHNLEVKFRRKSGEEFVGLLSIEPLEFMGEACLLSVVIDISELKRVQEALRHSERRFRDILESIHLIAVMLDADGSVIFCNDYLLDLTGWTREEVFGANWFEMFLHDGERASIERMYREGLPSGAIPVHYENDILTREGKRRRISWSNTVLRDMDGHCLGATSIGEDITERCLFEHRLRQAQKMEAIGTLAGGIAHDFNNILSAIMGYTELTQFDAPPGSAMRGNLGHVLDAAARARDLVKQILTFSRMTEQERKPVHLSPIIKEVVKLLRASLPSTIEIRQEIGSQPNSVVMADPTQIHQVLMNLCTNAAHAMREKGGVLGVSLEEVNVESMDVGSLHGIEPGQYLKLTVSDTGCGMSSGILERIFEPYFTTKRPGEGTGLGLAVVHGIVRSHGGAINVFSEPGHGSAFRIHLPRVESTVEAVSALIADIPLGAEGILLVDDEQILVNVGKRMLERLGYRVISCLGSLEAVEVFRTRSSEIDLVITDYTMPQMTGIDLAREIMRVRPGTPVILCTGFSEMIGEERVKEAGIREFLFKPVGVLELAKAIRRALESTAS